MLLFNELKKSVSQPVRVIQWVVCVSGPGRFMLWWAT